jgi:hypothetical protein
LDERRARIMAIVAVGIFFMIQWPESGTTPSVTSLAAISRDRTAHRTYLLLDGHLRVEALKIQRSPRRTH